MRRSRLGSTVGEMVFLWAGVQPGKPFWSSHPRRRARAAFRSVPFLVKCRTGLRGPLYDVLVAYVLPVRDLVLCGKPGARRGEEEVRRRSEREQLGLPMLRRMLPNQGRREGEWVTSATTESLYKGRKDHQSGRFIWRKRSSSGAVI